ncbi:WGR domain-containing protein [Candidatus Acetothermia bacterium]|nr:WGR domain-containing protein [Candidatus Acetothermia bacterium]
MERDKTLTAPTLFRWQSINPTSSRYRFYSVSLGIDLWGEVFIVKHWGRIGTRGQRQFVWAQAGELSQIVEQIQRERKLHGYRPIGIIK